MRRLSTTPTDDDSACLRFAGPPPTEVVTPAAIVRIADHAAVVPVWVNQEGGITFRHGEVSDVRYVKWNPAGNAIRLDDEVARLRWAGRFTKVPEVIAVGADDEGEWLVTEALPGESAVAERWHSDPKPAVIAIGKGLRRLHDALPAQECPFAWDADTRVAKVVRAAGMGLLDAAQRHEEHRNLEEALERVTHPPPVDIPVVCHGDVCAPNTLVDDNGSFQGHVDLGQLGTGDRWADLAVASWSTEWNYGKDWTKTLLEAYGVEPDPIRLAYYRQLWDLEACCRVS